MNKSVKTMTYKEFHDYCNERACDGLWSLEEARACLKVIDEINAIEVRVLGFRRKRKTEQAREEAWKKIILK